MEESNIVCSLWRSCKNHGKKCGDCKWNADNHHDYFETPDGKHIKYL